MDYDSPTNGTLRSINHSPKAGVQLKRLVDWLWLHFLYFNYLACKFLLFCNK